MTASNSKKKILYLEGLRGIAALVVVLYHYAAAFYPALYSGLEEDALTRSKIEVVISHSPINLLYDGNVSVQLFLILSGFVLTYRFLESGNMEKIRSIFLRRYVRLVIPALFSVMVACAFMKGGLMYNQPAAQISGSTWLGQFYNFEADWGRLSENLK